MALPKIGSVVVVRTPDRDGEKGRVVEAHSGKWIWSPTRKGSGWVRHEGVDGSLRGAEGWYDTGEIEVPS